MSAALWSPEALVELQRVPQPTRNRIWLRVGRLAANPDAARSAIETVRAGTDWHGRALYATPEGRDWLLYFGVDRGTLLVAGVKRRGDGPPGLP